jgi:hypothetical protein
MQPIVWLWVNLTTLQLDCPWYKANNCWCSVNAQFWEGATSMSIAVLVIPAANTFTVKGRNNPALWLSIMKHWKWLTLHWRIFLDGETTNSHPTVNHCMQRIVYMLLTSGIEFLIIFVSIQKLCGLAISDQCSCRLCEWEMTWPYRVPALSAGNWQ